MADYKKMYNILFNAVTDTIRILQKSQQEAEEIYMLNEKATINILPLNSIKNQDNENNLAKSIDKSE